MNQKTENYIVLKPIAERFSRCANEISDDEIKHIIKTEMREQLKKVDFGGVVSEWIEEYLEDKHDEVIGMYKLQLKEKFK